MSSAPQLSLDEREARAYEDGVQRHFQPPASIDRHHIVDQSVTSDEQAASLAMRVLRHSGAAVDALNSANATPLHYAAMNGMAEAADLLIERKANLEVVATGSQLQGTPLWAAVEAGQLLVAQRLLCAGADTECESTRCGVSVPSSSTCE